MGERNERLRSGRSTVRLSATTRAQVSGHRFLQRRIYHGLIFGDIRMIHDPLARRRRATLIGMAATILLAAATGVVAFLNPNPNPGDAPIWRAAGGQLYVRHGDLVYPTSNLASARLIAGQAAKPAAVGEDALKHAAMGEKLGILDAPAEDLVTAVGELHFYACEASDARGQLAVVVAAQAVETLAEGEAVLARAASGREYVLDASGLRELPEASSPAGRVIRRELGVSAQTPVWEVPSALLGVLKEREGFSAPDVAQGVVVRSAASGESWWRQNSDHRLVRLTEMQEKILVALGALVESMPAREIAELPDAVGEIRLPERAVKWRNAFDQRLWCAQGDTGGAGWLPVEVAAQPQREGLAALVASGGAGGAGGTGGAGGASGMGGAGLAAPTVSPALLPGAVRLSGRSAAAEFFAPPLAGGALAVETRHDVGILTAAGRYYPVASLDDAVALGITNPVPAPWAILGLLPRGTALSKEAALTSIDVNLETSHETIGGAKNGSGGRVNRGSGR